MEAKSMMEEESSKKEMTEAKSSGLAKPELTRPLGIEKFMHDMAEQKRIVLPIIKLVQSMSDDFTKEKIPPGVFRNSLSGETLGPEIEIVPVGILHYRRRFVERQVLCASNDAITGYGDPGGPCKLCPLSKWKVKNKFTGEELEVTNIASFRAKKDEELIPPPCTEQYVFPSVVLGSVWQVPGALVFAKTSYFDGINFGFLVSNAPLDSVYQVRANQTTNPKGTWYVPKVTLKRRASPEEYLPIANLRAQLEGAEVEIEGEEAGETSE